MKLYLWLGGLTAAMVAAQGFGCVGAPFTLTGGTGGAGTGSSVGSGGNATTSTASVTGSSSTGGVCMPPKTPCSLGCVDTNTDKNNCGACSNDCGPGTACHQGKCSCKLMENIYCSASVGCVDPTTLEHCGGCKPCPHPNSDTCNSGQCLCAGGNLDCGNNGCIDVKSDPRNCGMCGHTCEVDQACQLGMCVCRAGTTLCGTTCVDLQHDPNHCGSCPGSCPGGTDKCSSGGCLQDCPMGTMDCQSGCYASYHDDPANCGMCGTKCAVDQVCIMGQCEAYSTPKGCSTCPCTSQCSGGTMCCKQFVGNIPIAAVPLPICVAGGSCG